MIVDCLQALRMRRETDSSHRAGIFMWDGFTTDFGMEQILDKAHCISGGTADRI